MSWTNVPKPTGTPYINTNPNGKEQYDQASLTYDSATTFYDGVDQLAWSSVAKPTSSAWTLVAKPT